METLYKGNKMNNKDISNKHKRDMERTRSLNELRQVKTYGYRQKHPTRMLNPTKEHRRKLNHHDIIYTTASIMTPVEWLAANASKLEELSETRKMEGYASYYVEALRDHKVL